MATPKRRRLRNVLVEVRGPLWLFAPTFTILVSSLFVIWYLSSILGAELTQIEIRNEAHGYLLVSLSDVLSEYTKYAGLGMIFIGLMTFVLWSFALHKIFGPIVQMRRVINQLCEGNFDGKVVLRTGDGLHDVATDLNRLAEIIRTQGLGPKK